MHVRDTESLYTVGRAAPLVQFPSNLLIAHGLMSFSILTEQGKMLEL